MSKEREDVYRILELGKHEKNLHHKKGFGGLLFIDLSMIKFSKLSSYIRQLDKENQGLKDNWNYIKKMLNEARQEEYISGYCGTCTDVDIDFLLGKMQELQGSRE